MIVDAVFSEDALRKNCQYRVTWTVWYKIGKWEYYSVEEKEFWRHDEAKDFYDKMKKKSRKYFERAKKEEERMLKNEERKKKIQEFLRGIFLVENKK